MTASPLLTMAVRRCSGISNDDKEEEESVKEINGEGSEKHGGEVCANYLPCPTDDMRSHQAALHLSRRALHPGG